MLKTLTLMVCPETGEPQLEQVRERLQCAGAGQDPKGTFDLSEEPIDASNGQKTIAQHIQWFATLVAGVHTRVGSILEHLGLVRRPTEVLTGWNPDIGLSETRPDG